MENLIKSTHNDSIQNADLIMTNYYSPIIIEHESNNIVNEKIWRVVYLTKCIYISSTDKKSAIEKLFDMDVKFIHIIVCEMSYLFSRALKNDNYATLIEESFLIPSSKRADQYNEFIIKNLPSEQFMKKIIETNRHYESEWIKEYRNEVVNFIYGMSEFNTMCMIRIEELCV